MEVLGAAVPESFTTTLGDGAHGGFAWGFVSLSARLLRARLLGGFEVSQLTSCAARCSPPSRLDEVTPALEFEGRRPDQPGKFIAGGAVPTT